MSDREYKRFIDDLVEISESVNAQKFERGVWHPEPPPSQEKFQRLLDGLTNAQRSLIAELLREERSGGIHDTLCYLQDNAYIIRTEKGDVFSESPFGTDLYFDYSARLAGDPWPSID